MKVLHSIVLLFTLLGIAAVNGGEVNEAEELRIIAAGREKYEENRKLGPVLSKEPITFCPEEFISEDVGFTVRCTMPGPVDLFVNGDRMRQQDTTPMVIKGKKEGWLRPWKKEEWEKLDDHTAWIVCLCPEAKRVIEGKIIFLCPSATPSETPSETPSATPSPSASPSASPTLTPTPSSKIAPTAEPLTIDDLGAFMDSAWDEEVSAPSKGTSESR